jgi:D-ribose pyranose/furanose isomerase RbsD
MLKRFLLLALLLVAPIANAASPDWQAKVAESLPLLGHRNWILIVDSAYPLQNSSGIETVETNAPLPQVLETVLAQVNQSIHVRPDILMDAELPFIPEQDAPGVTAYRKQIVALLGSSKVESIPHDKIIANIDEAGKTFHVLVLKTTLAIPYTSVFLRLNCKYWPDEAESRMRARMKAGQP